MKKLDKKLMEEAGNERFRSEFHYARFEYYRSPKLITELENSCIDYSGFVLDDGCGSGGATVSLAEECKYAIGLDISPRFIPALQLKKEKKIENLSFLQADGCRLPFKDNTFDLVISHSVIEHTDQPINYLLEINRILKTGGKLFIETPPYYSFEGTHLPKPGIPIPLQLLIPRKILYKIYKNVGRKNPQWFKGGIDGSSMLTNISRGKKEEDSFLQKMTIGRLRRLVKKSGLIIVLENFYCPNGFHKIFPRFFVRFLSKFIFTRNFVVNTYKICAVKK